MQDLKNGNIELTEAELKDLVDKDCKLCYGRGWTYRDCRTGLEIMCKCAIKKAKQKLNSSSNNTSI